MFSFEAIQIEYSYTTFFVKHIGEKGIANRKITSRHDEWLGPGPRWLRFVVFHDPQYSPKTHETDTQESSHHHQMICFIVQSIGYTIWHSNQMQ